MCFIVIYFVFLVKICTVSGANINVTSCETSAWTNSDLVPHQKGSPYSVWHVAPSHIDRVTKSVDAQSQDAQDRLCGTEGHRESSWVALNDQGGVVRLPLLDDDGHLMLLLLLIGGASRYHDSGGCRTDDSRAHDVGGTGLTWVAGDVHVGWLVVLSYFLRRGAQSEWTQYTATTWPTWSPWLYSLSSALFGCQRFVCVSSW